MRGHCRGPPRGAPRPPRSPGWPRSPHSSARASAARTTARRGSRHAHGGSRSGSTAVARRAAPSSRPLGPEERKKWDKLARQGGPAANRCTVVHALGRCSPQVCKGEKPARNGSWSARGCTTLAEPEKPLSLSRLKKPHSASLGPWLCDGGEVVSVAHTREEAFRDARPRRPCLVDAASAAPGWVCWPWPRRLSHPPRFSPLWPRQGDPPRGSARPYRWSPRGGRA